MTGRFLLSVASGLTELDDSNLSNFGCTTGLFIPTEIPILKTQRDLLHIHMLIKLDRFRIVLGILAILLNSSFARVSNVPNLASPDRAGCPEAIHFSSMRSI